MDIFKIFKREKHIESIVPIPDFSDNWRQSAYDKNLLEGVNALQKGQSIEIFDDGRGYELALEIKHTFMLEYQKQLSEKISIDNSSGTIKITLKS
jgi:hypothetical protein